MKLKALNKFNPCRFCFPFCFVSTLDEYSVVENTCYNFLAVLGCLDIKHSAFSSQLDELIGPSVFLKNALEPNAKFFAGAK